VTSLPAQTGAGQAAETGDAESCAPNERAESRLDPAVVFHVERLAPPICRDLPHPRRPGGDADLARRFPGLAFRREVAFRIEPRPPQVKREAIPFPASRSAEVPLELESTPSQQPCESELKLAPLFGPGSGEVPGGDEPPQPPQPRESELQPAPLGPRRGEVESEIVPGSGLPAPTCESGLLPSSAIGGGHSARVSAWPLLALLWIYRRFVSPVLPPACRYHPSCSQYAVEAVIAHGPIRGAWMAVRRLARCHPWAAGGPDPVPPPRRLPDPERETR
jgi:uncharacterized protein